MLVVKVLFSLLLLAFPVDTEYLVERATAFTGFCGFL